MIQLVILALLPFVLPAGNPACYEDLEGDFCNLLEKPFNAVLAPYNAYLGTWFPIIFWGPIMAILWIRNANPILTGIIGVMIAGSLTTITPQALNIGWVLVALTITVTMFRLIKLRPENPQ